MEGLPTQDPTLEAVGVETKSSAEQAEEVLAKMRPREKASKSLGAAKGLIQEKIDKGDFAGDDKKEIREKAENALRYPGKEGDPENGKNLRAIFETLAVIGQDGKEISQSASENMSIKIGNGESARTLTLDEWRAELDAAQKPADGSIPDPQKIKELEDGIFGYSFPQDTSETENATKEKSPEDRVLEAELKKMENKRSKLKEGESLNQEEGDRLIALRFALKLDGKAGPIFKKAALDHLAAVTQKGEMIFGLEEAMKSLNSKMPQAENDLLSELRSKGVSEADSNEYINAIKQGKLPEMIKQGSLPKVEGLRELFFGDKLTDKDIEELMEIKKKKGALSYLLEILMIAAFGSMEMGKEFAPPIK